MQRLLAAMVRFKAEVEKRPRVALKPRSAALALQLGERALALRASKEWRLKMQVPVCIVLRLFPGFLRTTALRIDVAGLDHTRSIAQAKTRQLI